MILNGYENIDSYIDFSKLKQVKEPETRIDDCESASSRLDDVRVSPV